MRLKLPAYGRNLLDQRKAGSHPKRITIAFDERWFAYTGNRGFLLGINPDEYTLGRYDFKVCTGLPVTIADGTCGEAQIEDAWAAYYMAAEVAQHSHLVRVFMQGWPCGVDIAEAALCCKQWGRWPDGRALRWPSWWSEALDVDYRQRQEQHRQEWFEEFEEIAFGGGVRQSVSVGGAG